MFYKLVCATAVLVGATFGMTATANAVPTSGPYPSLQACEKVAAASWDGHYCRLISGRWYVDNGR